MHDLNEPELRTHLGNYFALRETGDLASQRLWRYCQEFLAGESRMHVQPAMFRRENQIAFGLAWWEEGLGRTGGDMPELRATALDHLSMQLSTDPAVGDLVRPLPYCPDRLVGRWQSQGQGRDRGAVEPVATPRIWLLRRDGVLECPDQPALHGAAWCAHEGTFLGLWLTPAAPLPRQQRWLVRRLEGAQMDLTAPGDVGVFTRWQRVEPA